MVSSVVKRYGKAILEIALESKKIDSWIKNFEDSEEIILDEDLFSFFKLSSGSYFREIKFN